MISLECPKCHGTISIESDQIDQRVYKCSYCGAQLVADIRPEGIEARIRLKEMEHEERLVNREFEHEEKLVDKELEHEKFKILQKDKQDKRDNRFIFILLACMALPAFFYFPYVSCSHNANVSELERLENEIQQDILEENYDSAALKANQLRLDDHYSDKQTESWDEKREYYQQMIAEKRRESDINNPDNILAPKSSADLQGVTGEEAKAIFTDAGFTNIEMKMVSGHAGWPWQKNLVDHINFGGKTEFTIEDYCNKDSKITIYYHES